MSSNKTLTKQFSRLLEAQLMSNKFYSFRSILVAALMLSLAIVLLNRLATVPASADAGAASFIIQLRDDPAAVYKAKTEKSGGTVSAAQLQSYRDGLRAKQDAFLADLKARGVSYSIEGVDPPPGGKKIARKGVFIGERAGRCRVSCRS